MFFQTLSLFSAKKPWLNSRAMDMFILCGAPLTDIQQSLAYTRGPFLETPDNFPGLKTILGAQYSPIVIQFLLILKAKF